MAVFFLMTVSVNANVEQKARLLEARASENAATIEQLRQERSLLVSDHKDLQHRFSEISEVGAPCIFSFKDSHLSNLLACL